MVRAPTWRGLAAALIALACAPAPASAQSGSIEYAVKAAFLTKFGAFVTWPGGAGPVTVCVAGDDPFGSSLEQAARSQEGRVMVRRLAVLDRSAGCHVAYVTGSPRQSVTDALQAVRGAPMLTVTDANRGGARGMIHFVTFQDRVRFHIDGAQAAQGGLPISSKLLSLALTVKR